jgi:3'-phosphoadenosine 5'-phosphosulfate sulfotransferase (PAPS reductase)/FAD synthetase
MELPNGINIVSVSGGKDSLATLLLAIEKKAPRLQAVFADTGHEHPKTYEYIKYLSETVFPIQTIKSDFTKAIEHKREVIQKKWRLPTKAWVWPKGHENHKQVEDWKDDGRLRWNCDCREYQEDVPPISEEKIERALKVLVPTGIPFLDLCLVKGRFPSAKARFCTDELKIRPIMEQINLPFLLKGISVISWQGVRRDESLARSVLPEIDGDGEWENGAKLYNYRPILDWTAEQVFKKAADYGLKPNPLYLEGMGRVGCMPCIHARKNELLEISRRYPEEFRRVAEWEDLVKQASKRDGGTFFQTGTPMGDNIMEVAEWAKTSFGGKQYDLERMVIEDQVMSCKSIYGLCE